MAGEAALAIAVDTGLWLRPVQYERIARAKGNAKNVINRGKCNRKCVNPYISEGRCLKEI